MTDTPQPPSAFKETDAIIGDKIARPPHKNTALAYLFCLFGGCMGTKGNVALSPLSGLCTLIDILLPGFHRFYAGFTLSGIIFCLTCGLCGLGPLLDLCFMPRMIRTVNEARAERWEYERMYVILKQTFYCILYTNHYLQHGMTTDHCLS
jgi:TM2 domain-containing membrane protein YozV